MSVTLLTKFKMTATIPCCYTYVLSGSSNKSRRPYFSAMAITCKSRRAMLSARNKRSPVSTDADAKTWRENHSGLSKGLASLKASASCSYLLRLKLYHEKPAVKTLSRTHTRHKTKANRQRVEGTPLQNKKEAWKMSVLARSRYLYHARQTRRCCGLQRLSACYGIMLQLWSRAVTGHKKVCGWERGCTYTILLRTSQDRSHIHEYALWNIKEFDMTSSLWVMFVGNRRKYKTESKASVRKERIKFLF